MMSLDEMYKTFPNEQACLMYIFKTNYPHPICPKCGRKNSYHYLKNYRRFSCVCGESTITPRKGTLFEESKIPLTKWFLIMYLIATESEGISSAEIQWKVGITRGAAMTIRGKITKMILEYLADTIERGHEIRLIKKIKGKHRLISNNLKEQYVAEFVFRERYKSHDPFQKLLDLALKYKKKK